VSLKKADGRVTEIKIVSEKGGQTKLKLPFKTFFSTVQKDVQINAAETGFVNLTFKPGATLVLKNGYE
jgi:alpha-L-fucosidase 2